MIVCVHLCEGFPARASVCAVAEYKCRRGGGHWPSSTLQHVYVDAKRATKTRGRAKEQPAAARYTAISLRENDLGDAEGVIESLEKKLQGSDDNARQIIGIEKDIEYMKGSLGRIEQMVTR